MGKRNEYRHRPIIVRFSRFCDQEAVLRNAAELRATKIFINEDLCPASQKVRNEKLPLLKQARSEGKIAYFSYTRPVIKERPGAYNQTNRTVADAGAAAGTKGTSTPHGTAAGDGASGSSQYGD